MKRTRERTGGPENDGWGWVARGKHGWERAGEKKGDLKTRGSRA